eukprot:scaffold243224_cov18-Tisochrysis_lutea.AAC.1
MGCAHAHEHTNSMTSRLHGNSHLWNRMRTWRLHKLYTYLDHVNAGLEWPLTQENGQRMLQMMFNAGIKSRREDGSKGAWYISFKGSDVEHRGAPKAAEAMLPKIRDMLAADKDAGLPLGGLGQIVPGNM